MDPVLADVITDVAVVVGAVVTGILVANRTAGESRRLERSRWKRELCATFIHAANEIRDAVHAAMLGGPLDDGWADNIPRAQRALIEIRIIDPALGREAGELWNAASGLFSGVLQVAATRQTESGAMLVPLDRSRYAGLDEAYRLASERFVERAAVLLG